MATIHDFSIGERGYFGRTNGEQTYGEIVGKGRTKLKVKQLEERGTQRVRNVGTIWTVPVNLFRKAVAAPVTYGTTPLTRKPTREGKPPFQSTDQTIGLTRGDKVSFTTKGGIEIVGYVKRVNQRSVSVDPIGGMDNRYWRVAPRLCRKVA